MATPVRFRRNGSSGTIWWNGKSGIRTGIPRKKGIYQFIKGVMVQMKGKRRGK